MKIRTKIFVGCLVVAILGVILGIYGIFALRKTASISAELQSLQTQTTTFTNILNGHYAWRNGLTEAVIAGTEFTGSLDPDNCILGSWLKSDETRYVTDPEILSLLEHIKEPHSFIHHEAKTILELMDAGKKDEVEKILMQNIYPNLELVISDLINMGMRYDSLINEKNNEIIYFEKTASTISTVLIIASIIIAILASSFLAWMITNSIINPLEKVTSAAESIAVGNLNVQVRYDIDDQIGWLVKSFQKLIDGTKEQAAVVEALANGDLSVSIKLRHEKDEMNFALQKMLNNLNNMFGEISSTTNQVSKNSKSIAEGAQYLAKGAGEQSIAVNEQGTAAEELSATIEGVARSARENAELANKAADLSNSIKDYAETSNRQMDKMVLAVQEISDASIGINDVLKLIKDIASQTNMLALNASIEAARAGQHGKGFVVVAEEVRELAERCADAAKNIGGLVENSIEKANLGEEIAGETAKSLVEIVSKINESSQIVSDIARSCDLQNTAIDQVNKGIVQINNGIEQVSQVVQQNSATAEESAASSKELSGQSELLEGMIAKFKLK